MEGVYMEVGISFKVLVSSQILAILILMLMEFVLLNAKIIAILKYSKQLKAQLH
jgi:hypothetical protein